MKKVRKQEVSCALEHDEVHEHVFLCFMAIELCTTT